MHPQPPNLLPQKASGLALASCVLAGITFVMVAIVAAVTLLAGPDGRSGAPTTGQYMAGFAMLGSICGGGLLGVIGMILGAIAVARPNRPRRLALIGLIANAGLLLMLWLVLSMAG